MAVIISISNGRADRRFDNPKNRTKYVRTFNFEAGVPIELNNEAEIEWSKNMAATYPTKYFLSEEEYSDYLAAVAEIEIEKPEVVEGGSDNQGDLPKIEELENKSIEDLRQLALEVGIGTTPSMNRKQIAKRILKQLEENPKIAEVTE